MSPGRKSLMSIGGGLSLLCCDSCKWEMDFKVVLSPLDRKIYFDTLELLSWLFLPLSQGECVLFCLNQLRSPAQNRFTSRQRIRRNFLKWDILAPLTLTFTLLPPASPFSALSQHWWALEGGRRCSPQRTQTHRTKQTTAVASFFATIYIIRIVKFF